MLKNGILGKQMTLTRRKEQENGEKCIMRSFVISILHKILYYSENHMKEKELGDGCASMRENRNTCRVLVGKPEEKRPHKRLKRGC